jgi:L-asparaginase
MMIGRKTFFSPKKQSRFMQKKVLLIYTGGTIGMEKDYATNSLRAFDFENLKHKVPEINMLGCHITTLSLDEILDSSDVGPVQWRKMAQIIDQNYALYDGFVILHGTDTMAYTASALSFMLKNLQKPVIITGAQLPLGHWRSDAKENLLTSLFFASYAHASGEAKIQEVCIYFEFKLLRGNRCTKFSSENFDAFLSPNLPALAQSGVHIELNETLLLKQKGDLQLDLHFSDRVALLRIFPGMGRQILQQMLHQDYYKVLVLQIFGSGTIFSDEMTSQILHQLKAKGILLVVHSQCLSGGLSLGNYENSLIFKSLEAISAQNMTLEACLTKAMHLLDNPLYPNGFKNNFEKNTCGELGNA